MISFWIVIRFLNRWIRRRAEPPFSKRSETVDCLTNKIYAVIKSPELPVDKACATGLIQKYMQLGANIPIMCIT